MSADHKTLDDQILELASSRMKNRTHYQVQDLFCFAKEVIALVRPADQFPDAGKMMPPSSDLISKAAELFIQSREPAALKHAEWALKQLMPHLAPPPMTSETISRLSVNASFESEAYARRVIAERDQQWLDFVGQTDAPAAPAEQDPGRWCEYVAGMVWCWLQMQNDALTDADEARYMAAITGIILRRLKWLKREPAPAQPQGAGEVAGYEVWWGVGDMQPHKGLFSTRPDAEELASQIKSNTEVRPVYRTTPPATQQAAVPTVGVPTEWRSALVRLAFAAKNSIENFGPDPLLKAAIDQACLLLHEPYNYTAQQAAQAVPDGYELIRKDILRDWVQAPCVNAAQAVPANLPEAITIACGLLAQSADELEAGHKHPTTGKVPEPEVAELIELHRKTVKQLGEGLLAMKGGQQ
jgi:hypothetical protein